MFALVDAEQGIGEVQRTRAQRMPGHLAVEDLASDVRVVGRDLTPALVARIGRHPDETDKFVAECLKSLNFHVFPISIFGNLQVAGSRCNAVEAIEPYLGVAIVAAVKQGEAR